MGANIELMDHDPLCPYRPDRWTGWLSVERGVPCRCDLIAQVREDQRRKTWRDLSTMSMWEVALLMEQS